MTLSTQHLNHPEVLQEVTAVFLRYEDALVANDVESLNAYFWTNPCTTRYGIADKQLGHEALVAYRKAVPAPDYTRQLHEVRITAFGHDMAVAMTEFTRSDTTLRGFQTQTWVRFSEGWKIVSAHVSMIPWATP